MDLPRAALFVALAVLLAALAASVVARSRSGRRVGALVAVQRAGRTPLRLLPIAAAFVCVLLADDQPLPFVVVLLAAALHFLAPHREDRALGRDGLQRGWYSLRFEQIEQWRLTGDHLRVLLRGEWEAVPAPARDHDDLRRVLDERAPGRESRFAR